MSPGAMVRWPSAGIERPVRWRSERGDPPPDHVDIADDTTPANAAYRTIQSGAALLWRGDYHNARQLLSALGRRCDRSQRRPAGGEPVTAHDAFGRERADQARRARLLGRLLVPLESDYTIPLRRAPDVRTACAEAYGPADEPSVVALRELLGVIGAHEWRRKGVEVPALDERIHPHYGVFAPIRNEYADLVATTPLPTHHLAFDIGTGTGVLAAILARRGVDRVVATDSDPRAVDCATDNLARLGLAERVEVLATDLFPDGRSPLIVCNPPWLPGQPSAPLERAVYDPDSAMLTGFLTGLTEHLEPGGEAWLVLSDLAERLGLRTRDWLLSAFDTAGMRVLERHDTRPRHARATDQTDPLHAARAAEVTSLWRLRAI